MQHLNSFELSSQVKTTLYEDGFQQIKKAVPEEVTAFLLASAASAEK